LLGGWVSESRAGGNVGVTNEATWWAFRPLTRPQPPRVTDSTGAHPIDAFIDARLREAGLQPNSIATPRDLLRRLSYDLLGLPPKLGDLEAFQREPTDLRWRQSVDRFLSAPQYGERWARHWLDVVRFAQSNGYERDPEKLFAWRYRDYVIRSFNQDKPYDQFVREQLAGDVIARRAAQSGNPSSEEWQRLWVATGFLHLGVMDDEPDDKVLAEYDALDDIVGTTGAAFLGLTLNCARCHDHKFDPLSQKDYYSLLSFFRGLRSPGKPGLVPDSAVYAPLATPEELARWRQGQERVMAGLKRSIASAVDDVERQKLKERLKQAEEALPPFDHALAARERDDAWPEVRVLLRGNPRSPGDVVLPSFPAAIRVTQLCEAQPGWSSEPSQRRLELAEWIASPANPLTARVMVNRIWHYHFGQGLVKSTLDFGRAGFRASHPELLDWLACEFIDSGWSIKHLHRLILTSQTWRRSSRGENPSALATDPGNELWWRHPLRRLDVESLRDTLLQISGRLNLAPGGRGFFPYLSGEVLAGGSRPGTDWEVSSDSELARRSIYSFIRRSSMPPIFELFDYSNVSSPLGERPTTTVAPQALLMINDRFVQEQATALADRLLREDAGRPRGGRGRWVEEAWNAVLGRPPTGSERASSLAFLGRQEEVHRERAARLLFRPDVPDTLSTGYFNKLPASRFLLGPALGWSYSKGSWPREYEGNRNMEPGRGPFGLWESLSFGDGTLECLVAPKSACESFSLLTRSKSEGGLDSGYELKFLLRENRVELRRVSPGQTVVLKTASVALPSDQDTRLRWGWSGAAFAVRVGDGPNTVVLEGRDVDPLNRSGFFGVRVWGAGVELDQVRVKTESEIREVREADAETNPTRRALESLALLLMNLNEVAYVD
jgi:hypothetical protein